MSYRLDPALPVSEAVRTVALAELDIAQSSLTATANRHRGVHSARKCFKRLRSLLVLARPGMPEPLYANLNQRVARIGKGLAAARDAHALYDAIGALERNTEPGLGDASIAALRSWLRDRRKQAERNLEQSSAAQSLEMLLELRPRFANLVVYPDDFTPLSAGLERSYRRARDQFKEAFTCKNPKVLHDWRKVVQQHWRHMQLLSPCWPAELSARAEAARGLSQVLGDDHDIYNLMHLATAPTMTFGTPEELAGFLKRCKMRLKELRQDAKIRGERLFVEKSRPFAGRVHAYWTTAAVGALEPVAPPTPRPVTPTQQQSNVVAIDEARPEEARPRAQQEPKPATPHTGTSIQPVQPAQPGWPSTATASNQPVRPPVLTPPSRPSVQRSPNVPSASNVQHQPVRPDQPDTPSEPGVPNQPNMPNRSGYRSQS